MMNSILILQSVALFGVSVISILGWPRVSQLTWDSAPYKWVLALLLCTSWAFACSASLMSVMDFTPVTCRAAIYLCVVLYTGSKLLVYLFFIERLHVIAMKGPRLQNPVYLLCVALLTPFLGVMILMMRFEVDEVSVDGCEIGLTRYAAIPLVCYDTFFGLFQSTMFACYICKHLEKGVKDEQTQMLKNALKVGFMGSATAVFFSVMNVASVVVLEHLHSYLCFTLCISDVVASACVCTFLLQPVSTVDKKCCWFMRSSKKLGLASAVVGAPSTQTTQEEAFEHELNTAAEMLIQMHTQKQLRTPTIPARTLRQPSSVREVPEDEEDIMTRLEPQSYFAAAGSSLDVAPDA